MCLSALHGSRHVPFHRAVIVAWLVYDLNHKIATSRSIRATLTCGWDLPIRLEKRAWLHVRLAESHLRQFLTTCVVAVICLWLRAPWTRWLLNIFLFSECRRRGSIKGQPIARAIMWSAGVTASAFPNAGRTLGLALGVEGASYFFWLRCSGVELWQVTD